MRAESEFPRSKYPELTIPSQGTCLVGVIEIHEARVEARLRAMQLLCEPFHRWERSCA